MALFFYLDTIHNITQQHESSILATDQAVSVLIGQMGEVKREATRQDAKIDEVQREQRDTARTHTRQIDEVQRVQRDTATRIDEVQRAQSDTATRIDNVEGEKIVINKLILCVAHKMNTDFRHRESFYNLPDIFVLL